LISFNTEKDFEDLLFENQELLINLLGLSPETKIVRQFSLHPYGVCDLLCTSISDINEGIKRIAVNLVELKNTTIKSEHLHQCARYKTFFDNLSIDGFSIDFSCHLIGMDTFKKDNSDLVFLCQSIDWLSVYECVLNPLHGLEFKFTSGWMKTCQDNTKKTFFEENMLDLINEKINEEALNNE
jgi:hypothetical protein